MNSHLRFAFRICLAVSLILCSYGTGWGGETDTGEAAVESSPITAGRSETAGESVLPEELPPPRNPRQTRLLSEASAGYRFYNVDGNGGRAREYEYLHSNPMLSGMLDYLGLDNKFVIGGHFLNDKDYYGDLTYDHKSGRRSNPCH